MYKIDIHVCCTAVFTLMLYIFALHHKVIF